MSMKNQLRVAGRRFKRMLLLGIVAAIASSCGNSSPETTGAAAGQTLELRVASVRPEAFSWFWNHLSDTLLKQANADVTGFRWLTPPKGAEHLGYAAGAQYEVLATLAGLPRRLTVSTLAPDSVRARVASDNFLGERPYSFIAQRVQLDQGAPFEVLIQYLPVGDGFKDSFFTVEIAPDAEPQAAKLYGDHLLKTLAGTTGFLMETFDSEYMKKVFYARGSYTVTPVDPASGTFRVLIQQNIAGITPDMLAWWWDHIGTPARYRLWQPVDHDGFEFAVAPSKPDLQYDIGAKQTIREYIGNNLITLGVEGADPASTPAPPTPIVEPAPNYFYSLTTLKSIQEYNGVSVPLAPPDGAPLPPNQLVHQWSWNADRSGVLLDTTFTLPGVALALNPGFGDDLGHHALREFQMMPYFLPRLFKREWLGQ